ncbi:hypothetical protein yc1106_07732 [Curvularia clavata]|uniref:Ribonucleases P/MRP subunit Pop8-like domain-containing protein n=1 Tax=Curvularia clavata TaxID=95742 RepID=A0A9Q8ZGU5_CURCL|nr:hypothetical protein yc1106_07732 [Curvularia clavata]
MSSGAAKRPLDPRARGNSPAGKRSRPLQAKHAAAPSPPPSRKPSGAGLSNVVPDSPKPVSGRNRPVDSAHGKERPQEVPGRSDQASRQVASAMSHRSGSGASTPTHRSAPPAPSMLPMDSREYANVVQGNDETINEKLPLGMQSLRKLQDRRRAIAAQASSTNGPALASNQLEVKLKAQQKEISQLRKERDEFERRLKEMETSLNNLSRSVDEQKQQQQDSSKDLQPLLTRLTALENSSLVSELQKTAIGAEAKTSALEKEMAMSKRSQESQKKEIARLDTWKTYQPKTSTDDLTTLATDKITKNIEEVTALIRREVTEVEARLDQRISSVEQSLQDTSSKAKDVKSLEAIIQEFPQRLADICKSVTNIELDVDSTNSKVERIEDDLLHLHQHTRRIKELEDEMDNCIDFRVHVRQTELPTLQKASEDITWRLRELEQSMRDQNKPTEKVFGEAEEAALLRSTKGQSAVGSVDIGNPTMRVDELERTKQGSESNRSSTPTISSASVNTLTRSVEQLAKDFKSLKHTQQEFRDSESKLADVIKRLDALEQNLQGLEALKTHAVSLEASHTEFHQRILSELHALQINLDSKITNIQMQQSSIPSEDAPAGGENSDPALATTTAVVLARMNDIQTELDSLSDDFNEAGQKIYEHSATIAVIKNQVPELFRQQFDPFKNTIDERFNRVNGKLDAHDVALAKLRKEFVDTHAANAQAQTIKADVQTVAKQVDSIAFALKDLEHRYQNISTEEMHQKMVHWFVQMYPTSAALTRDTTQLQQDVTRLKNYCNEILWVRNHSGVLRDLCKHGAQLQAIAQQYSTQNQEKIKQALSDAQVRLLQAQQAETETQKQVSQIAAQVAEMQAAAYQHRRDFDTMRDTLIEPNRDFFGLFGTVLGVLAQLQQVAESLNQNLPGTPLKLDWECYLPTLAEGSRAGAEEETARIQSTKGLPEFSAQIKPKPPVAMAQAITTNPAPTPLENTNTSANTDTSMPDASADTHAHNPNSTPQAKEKEPHILHQSTFRKLPWSYFHLTLTSASASTTPRSAPDLSPLLISPLLTSALRAYLGTMGAAIPIDILKTAGRDVWIRVPRQDARGVQAALSSWVGSVEGEDVGEGRGRVAVMWRVGGQSGVLGMVGGGDGRDMFG